MDRQNILRRSMKRRRANSPPNQSKRLLRIKKNIPDDNWLDILKFLTFPQWSQARLMCRKINGISERHISHLPRAIMNWASLYERRPELDQRFHQLVVYGAAVPQEKTEQWFVDHGISLDTPKGFPQENALIGKKINGWCNYFMRIPAFAQENSEENDSWIENPDHQQICKSYMFYAEFNLIHLVNTFRWPCLKQFLTFLFHPLSYTKEVTMYAVNQKIVDSVKDKLAKDFPNHGNVTHAQLSNNNKPFYIRCGTFMLMFRRETSINDVWKSLKWLEQNVRANSIVINRLQFTKGEDYENRVAVCRVISDFVFGGLQKCAEQKISLRSNIEFTIIMSLIEKFWTLPPIKCEIPVVALVQLYAFNLKRVKSSLGPNLVNREVDSQGAEFLYILENGPNRMRTTFIKADTWPEELECHMKFYATHDTILEAVKFLNYKKWSQMRFLCHRVNQITQSNQSKLQAFEVERLSLSENWYSGNSIVSFDQEIEPADAVRKWFQDCGHLCAETADMPLDKVFAGMNLSGDDGFRVTIQALFEDFTEKNMPLTRGQAKQLRQKRTGKESGCLSSGATLWSRPPQVFSAEFNGKYEFCGPILSHIIRLLYHPTAYFRHVSIFLPMTDKFCDITSPIRCKQLVLHNKDFRDSAKLGNLALDKDRPQDITLTFNFNDKILTSDFYLLVSEFLLLNASICARECIIFDRLPHPGEFVTNLFKKYETLEVAKAIPSILIDTCLSGPEIEQYLESNLVHIEYLILVDKICGKCDVKFYKQQNKMDGTRKIIAQFKRCLCYGNCSVYVTFE